MWRKGCAVQLFARSSMAFQHGVPAWRSSMAQWCSVAVAIQMTWSLLYSRRAECELMNAAGMHMAGGSGDSHEVRYAVPILWRVAS
jgi:hypothetical protein